MRRLLTSVALAAFAALPAVHAAPEMLAPPRFADPTRMQSRAVSRQFEIATLFVGREGVTDITVCAWLRWDPAGRETDYYPGVGCAVTPDAGRSTVEGGPTLSNCCTHVYSAPLPLSGGRWSSTCLPSGYAVPDSLAEQDWRFGCYCVNVETDSDLTLTVAGAERQVAASNGVMQVFNMLGATASRAVAVSAASAGATVRLRVAENPLCQFVGGQSTQSPDGRMHPGEDSYGGLSMREWRMLVFRASIANGSIATETKMLNATGELPGRESNTTALFRPHPGGFDSGARVRVIVCSPVGIGGLSPGIGVDEIFHVYGLRGYAGRLTDAEIERMRDLDAAELQRRGM